MSDALLAQLQQLVEELRALRGAQSLPVVLTKRRAARELSISLSKLKGLVRTGEIMVCTVGRATMVPASEVLRIAHARRTTAAPRPPRVRKERRTASPAEEARAVREALKTPRRPRGKT